MIHLPASRSSRLKSGNPVRLTAYPMSGSGRPLLHTLRYGVAALVWAALLSLQPVAAAQSAAGTPPLPLEYRSALFDYFREDYLAALIGLMVAEQRQQLSGHEDEASLMRAGIQLAYGMNDAAEQTFGLLLDHLRSGAERDQAWYALARSRYRRGEFNAARPLLRQTAGTAASFAPRAGYLLANLALREGAVDQATATIDSERLAPAWQAYHWFNRAMHQLQQSDLVGASQSLETLAAVAPADEEFQVLRERAGIAIGFAQLEADQPEQAAQTFAAIRLASPLVDNALLGLGWASYRLDQPREAIAAWQQLTTGDTASASVQESLLALPWLYEQLGEPGAALTGYQQSAEQLARTLAEVETLIAQLPQQSIEVLLALGQGDDGNLAHWRKRLYPVLSRNVFQHWLGTAGELRRLQQVLASNEAQLNVLTAVNADQQQAWQRLRSDDLPAQLRQRLQQLQQQRDALQQRFLAAEQAGTGYALMDEREQGLWQRWQRAAETAEQLAGAGQLSRQQRDKLRFLGGLLVWQQSELYPQRRWQLIRELHALDQLLAGSVSGLDAVLQAAGSEPSTGFAARLTALEQRRLQQQAQLQVTLARVEQELQQQLLTALQTERQRLRQYLAQVTLAMARLYDQATTGATP